MGTGFKQITYRDDATPWMCGTQMEARRSLAGNVFLLFPQAATTTRIRVSDMEILIYLIYSVQRFRVQIGARLLTAVAQP